MNAALRYFSGTGNSYRIAEECAAGLRTRGYTVELASITDGKPLPSTVDLVGFCFPVYAFALPRIVRKYLKALPSGVAGTKAFVLITAGVEAEAGYSVGEGVRYLTAKNYSVVHADVIEMPINWITAMNPPAKDEALTIIEKGRTKAQAIIAAILDGQRFHRPFNYPSRLSRGRFYWEYAAFKYLGVANLWRNFRTEADCNGCGNCVAVCPTGSIAMKNDRPAWSKSCEQCMRCVNVCARHAIWQKGYGSTKDRNRYLEPSFFKLLTADRKTRPRD